MINLRSDTQSLPTSAMRQAMADAEVGDDTYGEDPTVRRLEERVADLLGTEAAMLVLSGTMANLAALLVHCAPGDEVFLDGDVHVLRNETGGLAQVAGVVPSVVDSVRGHPRAAALAAAITGSDIHRPRSRLLWLENTHNRAGGTVLSVEEQRALLDVAIDHGLLTHIDGARIFNAATALGVDVRTLVAGVDSVYVDLTKGLSCPMGALLAGSQEFVEAARRRRRVLGGGMRQAGIMAACGLVALDEVLPRLSEDHERAQSLARGLADIDGITVPDEVESNMVFADVSLLGGAAIVTSALRQRGVLVSPRPPDHVRLVTYLQIDDRAISEALRRATDVAEKLAGSAAAPGNRSHDVAHPGGGR